MATILVGIGSAKIAAIDGTTVTLDRGIGGNGLTAITSSGYLLNITAVDCQAIAVTPTPTSDRNKVDTIQVAAVAGWNVGDWVAFRTDNATTTYATLATAFAALAAGDTMIITKAAANESRVWFVSVNGATPVYLVAVTHAGCTVETDIVGQKNIVSIYSGGNLPCLIIAAGGAKMKDMEVYSTNPTACNGMAVITGTASLSSFENIDVYGFGVGTLAVHFRAAGTGDKAFINCTANNMPVTANSPNSSTGFYNGSTGGTTYWYNCIAFGHTYGFNNVSGTVTALNNLGFHNGSADFSGAYTSSTNNASGDATVNSLGIGTLYSLTKTQVALLRYVYADSREIPGASRNMDVSASVLKNAGTPIVLVPYDTDGHVRDAGTPDIGVCDGFTGFGGGRQPRARVHGV